MILNTISFLFILQLSMNFKPPYPILSLLTFFFIILFHFELFYFCFHLRGGGECTNNNKTREVWVWEK